MTTRCYIALGSNLGNSLQHVQQAVAEISALQDCTFIRCSPWYKSKAIGPEQPDYINGVMAIDTDLPAIELLNHLQKIEQQHDRVRGLHWGPRTLDLDILLYGEQLIDQARLQIPHPEMLQRNFVLQPLYDIAPILKLPDGSALKQHLENCPKQGILRLA